MLNRRAIILFIVAMLQTAFAADAHVSGMNTLPAPSGANMKMPPAPSGAKEVAMPGKRSWQQSFELKLPISTAKIQVRSKFEGKGYILKHETPIGKRQEACVMLWEKGDSKVIVMLKKTDIDRTWFSQGEFKDAK